MRVNRTAKPTGRCWSSARIGSGSTVSICRYRTIQSSNTRTDGPPFFEDIGGQITVTIDPLVAESYPPQGKALRIVVAS